MRPPKSDLERVVRECEGNVTRIADKLGVGRQTVYTWLYQLDLARLCGVIPIEVAVARAARADDEARTLNLRVPGSLSKWARKHAIDTDRSLSAVVVESLGLLRAVVEGQGTPGRDGAGADELKAEGRPARGSSVVP